MDQLKDVRVDRTSSSHRRASACEGLKNPLLSRAQFLLEDDEDADVSECEQCVALVKAMLTMDGVERISPEGILSHPFVNRSPLLQECPAAAASRGDDSQLDRLSSVAPSWEEVRSLKEGDDGDVKTH